MIQWEPSWVQFHWTKSTNYGVWVRISKPELIMACILTWKDLILKVFNVSNAPNLNVKFVWVAKSFLVIAIRISKIKNVSVVKNGFVRIVGETKKFAAQICVKIVKTFI